jgi:hypothetical protein
MSASVETVRDLFRSLEQTLHERLRTIEDVLVYRGVGVGATGTAAATVTSAPNNNAIYEDILQLVKKQSERIDELQREIESFKNGEFVKNHILPKKPLEGLEVIPKREIVLPVETELEPISAADRLLLNKKARKVLESVEMGETQIEDHPTIEEEAEAEEEVEEAEQEVVEEAEEEEAEEAEQEVVEEAEEEVVEEEAEAEEEASLELEEFEYKGSTYYKDPENNVYMMDEEGELIEEPIGIWSEVKKRIIVKKAPAA